MFFYSFFNNLENSKCDIIKCILLPKGGKNMDNWWKRGVVYQIYPRSFKDSNDDGIGDLNGIISKLDYLKDLGINIIWLSPVYRSPNADNGYDISDYYSIQPNFGTMDDMDKLLEEAKRRDIKIVMDLVINHTSDAHEWFQKSRNKIEPYTDYYIWESGEKDKLPNNWTSFFAEDCWEFDEVRQEFYLHLFDKRQPDLNYRNKKVLEEIKKVMTFWLEKGVAGFRCDVINVIFKSSLENGKKKMILTGSEHYLSQEGTHTILKELREDVLSKYDCFTVGETVFVTPKMGKDLCDKERKELDMIFSFEHMEVDQYIVKWFKRKFSAKRFGKVISKWQNNLEWAANYFENHDQPRSVSRFGDDKKYWDKSAKLLATMLISLKGTPFIYQGQEIGMTNFDYTSLEEIEDVESHNVYKMAKKLKIPAWYRWKMMKKGSRDNARTPYQWNDKNNAGFSNGKPWLKVNKNYKDINLEKQINDKNSIYSFYKNLLSLRNSNETLIYGDFKSIKNSKKCIIYDRSYKNKRYRIFLNFSNKTIKENIDGVVILSNYENRTNRNELRPFEAVIVKIEV